MAATSEIEQPEKRPAWQIGSEICKACKCAPGWLVKDDRLQSLPKKNVTLCLSLYDCGLKSLLPSLLFPLA